jgi:hypothetical protein
MDQIIKALSQSLNLPEAVVRSGLGILLNFIKQKAGGTQFETLVGLLPGAAQLMAAPVPAGGGDAGGMLGGLLAKAGGLLGGNLGGAAEALSALQGAGIPMDKAGPLAGGFFEQAKAVAGPEAVDAVLQQLPALAAMFANKQN